jgi:hypothetical protein
MTESLLLLELLLLTEQTGDAMLPAVAAKTKTAAETAWAAARPAVLPASVATEAIATEATSWHRGAEADAPCISALFALAFAARGGDSRTAALGVRLRAALAAGWFGLTGITGMDSCLSLSWCLSRQYFRDNFDILQGWGGAANPTMTSGNCWKSWQLRITYLCTAYHLRPTKKITKKQEIIIRHHMKTVTSIFWK